VTEQMLDVDIYLNSKDINNTDLNLILNKKIKEKLEGKCHQMGFILPNSVQITHKSLGKLVSIDNTSKIRYHLGYKATIINPSKGNQVKCYINNITKAGIIAYIKMNEIIDDYDGENNITDSPLIIIIPSGRIDNIENMNVNQTINIEVTASRTKFNSKNIQIIGKLI